MSEPSKDVVEAARFYRECVEEARKDVINWDALPFNEVCNMKARIINVPASCDPVFTAGFILNGQTMQITFPIENNLSPQEFIKIISEKVAEKIAYDLSRALIKQIK